MTPDQVAYATPAQRLQNRRDVVPGTGPRHNPGPEVYRPLHSLQVARSSPAPDREAVVDMGEGMTLDQEFSGFRGEVVSNFKETEKDGIALFDNSGDVRFPG